MSLFIKQIWTIEFWFLHYKCVIDVMFKDVTRTDTRLSYVWFYFVVKLVSLHNQTLAFLFILSTFCNLHWLHPVNPKRTSPALSSLLSIKALICPLPSLWNPDRATQFTVVPSHHQVLVDEAMMQWCKDDARVRQCDGVGDDYAMVRWQWSNALSHHHYGVIAPSSTRFGHFFGHTLFEENSHRITL